MHSFHQGNLSATGARVDYPINVTDTRFPVTAMLVDPGVTAAAGATPDFDLHLFNPTGTEVARGYTSSRQETVAVMPAATGTYTVSVRSYNGSGTFQLDVSAGGALPVPGPVSTTLAVKSLSPAADVSTLAADDDRFYNAVAPATTSRTKTTAFVATFSGVPSDVTGLTVTYKAKSSLNCNQRVSLDRAGSWVLISSTSVGTSEALVTTSPTDSAKGYVAATGTVRVKVQCSAAGDSLTSSGDLLTLRYDRPGA